MRPRGNGEDVITNKNHLQKEPSMPSPAVRRGVSALGLLLRLHASNVAFAALHFLATGAKGAARRAAGVNVQLLTYAEASLRPRK